MWTSQGTLLGLWNFCWEMASLAKELKGQGICLVRGSKVILSFMVGRAWQQAHDAAHPIASAVWRLKVKGPGHKTGSQSPVKYLLH